jgi:HK97 family phage portal protein
LNKVQKFFARVIMGSTWDDFIRSFLRGDDVPTINGQIPVTTETAMRYTAVFACIRVLSETLASMPIMLYLKKKDGDRETVTNTRVYDILHNAPNEEMSPFNFKEACMVSLNTGGNAVCERLVNAYGETVGLYPHPWSMVRIERDRETGQLKYTVRSGTKEKILTRAQVFHVTGLSYDGVVGMSPIEYAASAIRLGLSYEQFGVSFYKNGMNPSIALEYPAELGEEAFLRLKADIDKNYAGVLNVGRPFLAEGGAKVHELTIKPADAQLIENKRFQIEDIARIYRVPMHLIQELSRSTNNNIEQQSLEFVIYTMLPWCKRIEEAANMQLLTRVERIAGYYLEFKMDSLLRGDAVSRANAYATGRQWGWLCVNDIRRLENMNAIDNGDIFLTPANMYEAGKEPTQGQQKAQQQALADEICKMIKEGRA